MSESKLNRCAVAALCVLMLVATATAGAPFARAQEGYVSEELLQSLRVQAEQLDVAATNRQQRGESVSDELGLELREIFGELARIEQLQHRHQTQGGEGTGVPENDTARLADRIAYLRLQLRGVATPGEAASPTGRAAGAPVAAHVTAAPLPVTPISIPGGTQVVLELQGWLNSKDTQVGDRFGAILVEPVRLQGKVVIPAGAAFEGQVVEVKKARRPSKGGSLKLRIDTLIGEGGHTSPVEGIVVGANFDDLKGDGADGGKTVQRGILGALLGGLLGGSKGALIGLGAGAGGTLLAGKGEELDLPPGSRLRVRFEQSVNVTWTWKSLTEQSGR